MPHESRPIGGGPVIREYSLPVRMIRAPFRIALEMLHGLLQLLVQIIVIAGIGLVVYLVVNGGL